MICYAELMVESWVTVPERGFLRASSWLPDTHTVRGSKTGLSSPMTVVTWTCCVSVPTPEAYLWDARLLWYTTTLPSLSGISECWLIILSVIYKLGFEQGTDRICLPTFTQTSQGIWCFWFTIVFFNPCLLVLQLVEIHPSLQKQIDHHCSILVVVHFYPFFIFFMSN